MSSLNNPSQHLHVTIIPSWYPGSPDDIAGSFFREQAVALAECGHKIGVIYPALQRHRLRSIPRKYHGVHFNNYAGVAEYRWNGFLRTPMPTYFRRFLLIRGGIRLYEVYVDDHGTPDLLHAHSALYGGVLARELSSRFDLPFIITEHSSAYAFGLLSSWQRRVAASVAGAAAYRIAVSKPLGELLRRVLGNGSGPWTTLPNMVDPSFTTFSNHHNRPDPDVFTFVCVAFLKPHKAVHNLIEAFAVAFHQELSVVLKIVGDGEERTRLENLANRLGLVDRVQFLGSLNRQQIIQQLSRTHCLVHPSLYETFGVAVIEALALGKPVIATRCGGPESIVRNQDGLLVPPNDIEAFANALREMHSRYHEYNAEEIRHACETRYSAGVVCEKLTNIYEQVLNRANDHRA